MKLSLSFLPLSDCIVWVSWALFFICHLPDMKARMYNLARIFTYRRMPLTFWVPQSYTPSRLFLFKTVRGSFETATEERIFGAEQRELSTCAGGSPETFFLTHFWCYKDCRLYRLSLLTRRRDLIASSAMPIRRFSEARCYIDTDFEGRFQSASRRSSVNLCADGN